MVFGSNTFHEIFNDILLLHRVKDVFMGYYKSFARIFSIHSGRFALEGVGYGSERHKYTASIIWIAT